MAIAALRLEGLDKRSITSLVKEYDKMENSVLY